MRNEREVKTRLRPDNTHKKSGVYFMHNVYRKFYSSRRVVIHVGMLFIWKPQLLLCLICLIFGGKIICTQMEVQVFLNELQTLNLQAEN